MWCLSGEEREKVKKKILGILMAISLICLLSACSNDSNGISKKEYTADEFGKLQSETNKLFEEKSVYLTDEERNGEEGREIYAECSKDTGLPYNEEITIRGVKEPFFQGMIVRSEDESCNIFCRFSSEVSNNIALFIEDGESVVVKGIFSKEGEPYGFLADTEFISPSQLDISYMESDINEILSKVTSETASVNTVIHGQISSIISLDEFKKQAADYIDFDTVYFSDNVARMDGPNGGTVYFSYADEYNLDISVGDKIAIQGELHSMLGFDDGNGNYTAVAGYIGLLYGCYNFDSKT